MGSLRLTLCTAVLAVTAFAPAAHAADPDSGSVLVTPASPAPGTDVALRVKGCSGPRGTAVSGAFVSDALLTGSQGSLSGETRVRTSLKPGAYAVRITCADYVISGRITVAGDGSGAAGETGGTGGDRGSGQGDRGSGREPGDAATPIAPVHAGGGGTAHFATVATTESGPDTVQEVSGLTLAGIAAAVVGLRARRRRKRR
ncbi:hypothetical protein [Streptomyces alanosinicus]|uniref:LPXTG cell wall anchor domain-containing protein n=1 Tax=Streptomyces alanosinicus TaxID=68171 RepID=A0A919CZP9_9ACTN|nr:hypothetical protein [Streptomyces alanosinicus]GHD99410.1 hypothetical protein GCM10010339_10610 [Streptomyces alanosinicus]